MSRSISSSFLRFEVPRKPVHNFLDLAVWMKLLKTISGGRNLKHAKMVHGNLFMTYLDRNLVVGNSLINCYAKCCCMSSARHVFDKMIDTNVVSWCSLMDGYLQHGHAEEVRILFEEMLLSELKPNHYVFSVVLRSCSTLLDLNGGNQLHACIEKLGFMSYTYVENALLDMYCKCGALEDFVDFYHCMNTWDISSCNVVVSGFLKHGFHEEALEFFTKMQVNLRDWDPITYTTILNLCSCMKYLRLGLEIHDHVIKAGISYDMVIGCALVDMYGKCGKLDYACRVFENFRGCKNVVMCTSLVTGYAQNGSFEEALNLFTLLFSEGIQPNEFTFAVLLNSCACLSTLDHGKQLHCHAKKMGFSAHLSVQNALINLYSKCGNVGTARSVFDSIGNKDVISWNSIISGYSQHGFGAQALQIFKHMLVANVVPNYVTFVGILQACGHGGLVNLGFYYLNHLMKEFNITPGLEHYTCMVGLLGRAQLFDEAESLIKSMPVQHDVVLWRTLLSACQIYNNVAVGKNIAEFILQFYPDDTGTYVLMSNMYAKSRRWYEVSNMRSFMKINDIKKEPGVSWIQVKNCTHVFISEDREHPQLTQIHEKLSEVLCDIKLAGYVPESACVFHDVDHEEREHCLMYHSEKLAVAFGLINIPIGATICIFKNLRVCDDCHSAMKFISVTSNRQIILRDANRFHCFRHGVCSCGDYW